MNRFKKVLEWVVSILVVVVFIISALAMIGAINGNKTGVNSVFGKVMNTVQSDSMEDVLFEGDLIFGDVYEGQVLEKNQIITFRQKVNNTVIYNTHRIVGVEQIGNTYVYQTKGDHEPGIDPGYRLSSDIVAVYNGTRIAGVGSFIDWVKEPIGFIICVILPLVAVIAYEAYKIISVILKTKEEKFVAQSAEQTPEDVKAEIIKQYLASQTAASKEETAGDAEVPSETNVSTQQGSGDSQND